MKKQGKIIVLIVSLASLFLAASVLSFNMSPKNINETDNTTVLKENDPSPALDNSESGVIATGSRTLGSLNYGRVIKEGPYGNKNSPVKVAYIVGVHPLESNAHRAVVESIKGSDNSLNKCYYIYRVVVTQDASNYDKGRMNGQLLAQQFVVPDIKSQGFQLAVDVHSNRGNYEEKRFVFAPVEGSRAESIARNIKNRIPGIVYHFPFSQTSPQYVTVPIINAGIPAIVYETYINEPYSATKSYAEKFVSVVDNI